MNKYAFKTVLFATAISISNFGLATELIYVPKNPSFGGNPLNGSILLNNAQAQNKKTDPEIEIETRSELDRFTDSLRSRLLSQLLSDIGAGKTGTLDTDDFSILIVDNGEGEISVKITDKNTNQTTEIVVDGLEIDS
ncbi:curli assembly protein CsgF [uncultured Pseudoteredinibacter sp.]|uniref:curli assembly protein CsgF n=1 Tax=uncultured Pseudoteredinibacter sp. TaxID=1641701 RepID=UPI00262747F4|nr:curli assembly protein CsgF [uncultured Pseudoteredinibacter sp.]